MVKSFDESVKKGLKDQLWQNRAIYLRELMQQDWNQFCKEFDKLRADDNRMAMALIERMKTEIDTMGQGRTYKVIQQIRKFTKFK